MAKTARTLLAAMAAWAATSSIINAQHLTVSVNLRNDARVSSDTLEAAQSIASQTYRKAGIDLLWSDSAALTVILRPRASPDTARRAGDAMGYTPGGGDERGRLAFVMINRVNEIADGYRTVRSVVLGAAIAHELGHLLLSKDHSSAGIMKTYWNQADFRKARTGELTFTDEQAQRLRAALLIPNP